MPDIGAPSGVVAEYSSITGTGPYVLSGAVTSAEGGLYLPFASLYLNGEQVVYEAFNTAFKEVALGVFNASSNSITRGVLKQSNTGSFIDWPAGSRPIIRPLIGVADAIGAGGIDVINIDTGTTYTLDPIRRDTQLVWNSTDYADKTTTIEGSIPANKGILLDIKTTPGDGTAMCVVPESGTIAGLPNIKFNDNITNLSLISNAAKSNWEVRCLCDFLPVPCDAEPFEVGAVSFPGTAFLWNFPAMSDSPEGSMSVWLKVEQSQLSGGYPGDTPDGDLFQNAAGNLISGPPATADSIFLIQVGTTVHHYGGTPSLRQVNPITNVTSANPAVITFTHPHGIPAGAVFQTFFFSQTGWSAFEFQSMTAVSVTSNTITTNFDTTGFPAFGSPSSDNAILIVYNALQWEFEDVGPTNRFNYNTTNPLNSGAWVNVLASWKTDLSAGSKILNLYYGDTRINPDGSAPSGSTGNEGDVDSSFSIPFSTSSVSETDSWMVGGYSTPNEYGADLKCIICEMAELWFAPGQYIDFSIAANRQEFHDAITGKPIFLGADGSLPTGTAPTLYQHVPAMATDPYAYLGLPLRFVNPQFNQAELSPGTLANSITDTPFLTCSFWVWGSGDHVVVNGFGGIPNKIELDAAAGTIDVHLWDNTVSKEFRFEFPVPSDADVFNVCFSVDTNHPIGSKIVNAYVNNVSAAVTVTADNAANWSVGWDNSGGGWAFANCMGFIAELWIAPDQFFDPQNKFMDTGGDWIDIGTDGAGANGTAPSIYLSCRGTDPASGFATNRGTGGTTTQNGPFLLVPDGAVFLKNLSGNRNLLLNSAFTAFPLAATSPSD